MYSKSCTLIFTRSIRVQKNRHTVIPKRYQNKENLRQLNQDDLPGMSHSLSSDPFEYTLEHPKSLKKNLPPVSTGEKKRKTWIHQNPPSKKETLDTYGLKFPMLGATTPDNQFYRLEQCLTPLSQIPYEKQLKLKYQYAKDVLQNLSARMREDGMHFYLGKRSLHLQDVRPSPEIFAYRNKDEFSINTGADGNPKTVGYYIGSPKDPMMCCVPPTYLINIKESHKLVAKNFQKFIESSHYGVCTNFEQGGIWRNLTVRSNSAGDLMAIVTIFPDELIDSKKEEIKDSLKNFFFEGEGSECNLASLYIQACANTKCSHADAPYELIEGKEYLMENCLGATFNISPESFFQINTGAAEVLYNSILEISEMSSLSTLLDVCCGTGPISIISSPYVRGTIGIDSSSAAIGDAIKNAAINDINNCTFHRAKVEKFLPILGPSLDHCSDVIAVLNPSRGGLHPALVQAIRECEAINKIVYITCKASGVCSNNFYQLMTKTNRYKHWSGKKKGKENLSDPFMPRYTIPVDMFPHTKHVEMVILFERIDREQDVGVF